MLSWISPPVCPVLEQAVVAVVAERAFSCLRGARIGFVVEEFVSEMAVCQLAKRELGGG